MLASALAWPSLSIELIFFALQFPYFEPYLAPALTEVGMVLLFYLAMHLAGTSTEFMFNILGRLGKWA